MGKAKTRSEWLEERRLGIGATDSAVILGAAPWSSPLQVWAEKVGVDVKEESAPEPEHLKWGRLLEPLIAEQFGEETKRLITAPEPFVITRDEDEPILFATIDREQLLVPGCQEPRDIMMPERESVLELKTQPFSRHNWQREGIPEHYWIQVQHQLMVTRKRWGSIAVLTAGSSLQWADIPRDERFIDNLREVLTEWWLRYVIRREAPPAQAADNDVIKSIYKFDPTGSGSVELPGNFIDLDDRRQQINEMIGALEQQKDEIEAKLKQQIGTHRQGVLPNGIVYTWAESTRQGYIVPAGTVRTLRRKQKHAGNRLTP